MEEFTQPEILIQKLITDLLQNTKKRFETANREMSKWLESDRRNLEEDKKFRPSEPSIYEESIDTWLEHIAEGKAGISQLNILISLSQELEQKIVKFWQDRDKAMERIRARREPEDKREGQ